MLKKQNNKMFKNLHSYLLNYPLQKSLIRLYITSILFYILILIKDKYALSSLTIIGIATCLLWFGLSFSFLVFFVKLLDNKSYDPVLKKVLSVLYFLFLIIIYIVPILCYCMAKYYGFQIDDYRSHFPQ